MEMQLKQRGTTTGLRDAVSALQERYGMQAMREGLDPSVVVPPHIASGIVALDALSGCGGLPQGHLSLFTGGSTSGKFSIALRFFAAAQGRGRRDDVAVLDFSGSATLEAFHRAGVDQAHLLFARPAPDDAPSTLLGDVLHMHDWRCVLVTGARRLRNETALPDAARLARRRRTALLLLDDDASPADAYAGSALAHHLSLHLHFERIGWRRALHTALTGYTTRARLERSRWTRTGRHCEVEIDL